MSFNAQYHRFQPGVETEPLLRTQPGLTKSKTVRRSFAVPLPAWLVNYRRTSLQSDLIGAITVASLYIPLCFSFASLGHVPPASSLYAFVFQPLLYALLGSSPLMIVGPEATGSLLVGSAVEQAGETVDVQGNGNIAGIATAVAGAILLAAGSCRLGFLECLLNRPLMKGFIGGVGIVLVIDQAVPGLGLSRLEKEAGLESCSALRRVCFLVTHLPQIHALSAVFSVFSLACVLLSTSLKKRLEKTQPWLVLFPERFLLISLTAVLAASLGLEEHGLPVVGSIQVPTPALPPVQWPFCDWARLRALASTSLFIALLGYFESSVTSRSLTQPSAEGHTLNNQQKPNRELAALGTANIIGGCFATLPAFGGFGRSKLNVQAGGKTPMSSIFLGLISLLCALFISPYLYYVPKPTLAAMSCAVGISMLEESLHDIKFFWKLRAWGELGLMFVVAAAMILGSLPLGVEVGLGVTVLSCIRSSARAGTSPSHVHGTHSDSLRSSTSFSSLGLIGDITFCNVNDVVKKAEGLVSELGSNQGLVLDLSAVQSLDACSVQSIGEIMRKHRQRGVRIHLVLPAAEDAIPDLRLAYLKESCYRWTVFRGMAGAEMGST